MQPAFGVDGRRGGLWVIEIAEHDVRSAKQHLAGPGVGGVDAQFEVRYRAPARGGHRDGVVIGAAHGAESSRFGEPVGGQHDVEVEFVLHPFDQNHRHGRRPGDSESQRAQIEFTAGRVVEQRLVDRRRPGQHGDSHVLHHPHGLLRVEGELRNQRRAGLKAGQNSGLVPEVVEERVDAQIAVGSSHLAARRPRGRRRERLPVRTQHTLAATGGAGGEQDVGDVVGAYCGRAGIHLRQRNSHPGHELVPGAVIAVEGNTHDVPQCGQGVPIEVGHPVGTEEPAHPDQQRRLGAQQDIGGFGCGVAGVQRNQGRAGVVDG